MTEYFVLGRFQPFHRGHESLINCALNYLDESSKLTIAIGSAQLGWQPENPWTIDERRSMIQAWASSNSINVSIVGIDDINDPPNWVEHASNFHGTGTLITSDEKTAELYQASGFEVILVDLNNRENYEGWRIRKTALMLSTVYDDDAVREVLSASVPLSVVDWLIENDGIFRLSTFQSGMNVG
mgnify:FL=1